MKTGVRDDASVLWRDDGCDVAVVALELAVTVSADADDDCDGLEKGADGAVAARTAPRYVAAALRVAADASARSSPLEGDETHREGDARRARRARRLADAGHTPARQVLRDRERGGR